MSKRLLGSIVLGFIMFVGSVFFILIKFRANEEGRMGGRLHLFHAWIGRHDLGLPDRRPERVILRFV
jgi:hypothetical protein